MNKTLSRFFRRKSVSETELKKDYPTHSDDSDHIGDERRCHKWQRNLNSDKLVTAGNMEPEHKWDYESEYNYSVGSSVSIIDAYKENKHYLERKLYSDRDLERCIEARMRDEFSNEALRRYSLNPGLDGRGQDRDRDRSGGYMAPHIGDRGNDQDDSGRPRHGYNYKESGPSGTVRRESSDRHTAWDTMGKKKVRKQYKQRKRARDLSPDVSDDDAGKYNVNISMDELNNIIKRNVTSVVKTIVSATSSKKPAKMPLDDSFSTETETIFSGSSSHSTDIPVGLLQKQIKAQLDVDKLRGIIKTAVAKEAHEHRRHSLHPNITVPTINEIPTSPCTSHRNVDCPPPPMYHTPAPPVPQHTSQFQPQPPPAPQHTSQFQQQPPPLPHHSAPPAPSYQTAIQHTGMGPPPAPPPPPLPPQQVTFNLPLDANPTFLHSSLANRRSSLMSGLGGLSDNPNRFADEYGLHALDMDELSQAQMARFRNRRHTLANLADTGMDTGMDKLEQFSNALKLLDKTLKRDDSTENKPDIKTEADKQETSECASDTTGIISTNMRKPSLIL